MNIVVEKQPKCVATLRVEIPAEKVRGERDQIVRNYAAKARIPGYRPGKAPLPIVEKRFAKDISEELHDSLVNQAFDEAMRQENLKVLDFGNPGDLSTLPDGGISFASQMTLAPEVRLPEYKSIAVTVPPAEVPEEDLQAQLKSLQERFADFNAIEGRAAAMGDFAVIDYSSTVDGKPTEEFLGKPAGYLSGREGFWMRLDEKAFLPGFAAQVVGMNPGDSRDITLTLPADFPVADLQNREIVFSVTLNELKEAVLPALDDELAAKLAPGKTMAEVTDIIRGNMQSERKRRIDDMKVNQIVAYFNTQVDFELPDELVTQETQSQADAMVSRGVQAGMSEEEIASQQAEIFASAGQQAVSNLRTNFLLQEIARAEGITVSDAELVNHLAQVAQSRKIAPKKLIRDMQRAGRLPSIRNSIAIGKAIDFLVGEANVSESAETVITEE
ncbi:MAG: trigger factor [Akkermansiaceae bacterium]|jgi:trigger factor|nr:trigger factor [Akkermansiaceae bacterium]MCU0777274.1 trigger factor [Akkermansiaceae bacterium]